MHKLDPSRIRQGKIRLYIALGALVAGQLLYTFAEFDPGPDFWRNNRWPLSRLAFVVVAALGTVRGSKSIQYVFLALLGLQMVGGIYLLLSKPPETLTYAFSLPSIIASIAVLLLLLRDQRVAEFLAYQRGQHYGQRVRIAQEKSVPQKQKGVNPEESTDSWDNVDDLFE
ncbi:MAG: hypothetical protein AAGN35_18125 [Bacteroidota bacterium]